jgi:hypothetical protein
MCGPASARAKLNQHKKSPLCSGLFVLRARGEIRTPTPEGTTPSRWRVYQFHHVRKRQSVTWSDPGAGFTEVVKRVQMYVLNPLLRNYQPKIA